MAFQRIANSERMVLDLATHRYIYEKTENTKLRLLSTFHRYLSLTPKDIDKLPEGVLPWQLVKDVWCFYAGIHGYDEEDTDETDFYMSLSDF